MSHNKPKVIAFYLPQYHPTPHNDQWWGKGYTEWTSVARARRLYPGHYQPKVPADLGFYDLRMPETREAQVELAKEAGVYGFCYYHYWFREGHEELDRPFKEVVASKKPDFPFCLCWANHSWYAKNWNPQGVVEQKLLEEQMYLGEKDNEAHFYSLLDAFKDPRYIKVDGKLLFLVFLPLEFKNFKEFKAQWNKLAIENGLPEFYFVGQILHSWMIDDVLEAGFDGVNHCHRLDNYYRDNPKTALIGKVISFIKRFVKMPYIISYKKAISKAVFKEDYYENVFPTIMPNWDHTPRSKNGGSVLHNATPELFEQHANELLSVVMGKQPEHRIVFLKSWNEWGEGNYMEPDLKYGKGFIKALRNALYRVKNNASMQL